MKIKEKPMQFTLFYSGLVGSIQAVGFKDTKKLLGQTDDLYIDTIEYSAYAELLKQNEELREKNDHLEDKVYHSTRLVEELRLGNLELKRKLEVAKNALEFYGEKDRWKSVKNCEEESKIRIDAADFDIEVIETRMVFVGGKQARQALKEIGEYE